MFPNELSYYVILTALLIVLSVLKTRPIYTAILLAVSYISYITFNNYLVASLVFTSALTFYCGRFIFSGNRKKLYLALAILGSLGQLFLFKYSGLLAPLGISYFTFMSLGYVFDIYRGKIQPTDSLSEYALFVSFFPIISSGPIIRARDFLSQIKDRIEITPDNFQQGLALITTGLIMKLIFADNLASYVDPRFANLTDFGSRTIILATLAFGIQLYCDFGGYSNIALGSARLLGFKFPMNFNNPYFAMSPADFWHRWNISLSTWLRDYLYIPLGGNRKGLLRTHLNLIITMVVCGLWHGATWNFLIWGAYHGALLSLNRLIRLPENRLISVAGMILTQYLVFLGWLIFKVNDPGKLAYCVSKFLVPTGLSYTEIGFGILAASVLVLAKDRVANNDWIDRLGAVRPAYWFIYLVLAMMLIYWGHPVEMTKFIYAGF